MRCPHALAALLFWLLLGPLPTAVRAEPPPPHSIPSFPIPGEVIEPLTAGEPPPYLPLLPELRIDHWRLDADALEPMPAAVRLACIGPPLLRLDYGYAGRVRRAPRQLLEVYRRALTLAGWQLDAVPGAPADAVARYTGHGRALWLKLHADAQGLHLGLSEPAAHFQAAALRAALAQTGRVTLYGIPFEINKDYLRLPEAEPVLRQILLLLQTSPDLKLEIQVHTDDSFRNVWGRSPSRNRAQELMRWLITHGIPAARLVAQGLGESRPVASNRTPEGRARNRRVELVQLPSTPQPPQ
jgi:outer membrane protein OmpA-like peptidoglycan-associated protein